VPTLLVATGSGLAPFRALLQDDLQRRDGPPIALVFGCRTQADILWRDELERWAATVPRFSLTVTLSRADRGWTGAKGWVQEHVVRVARTIDAGLVLLWTSQHLDNLRRLEGRLAEHARTAHGLAPH